MADDKRASRVQRPASEDSAREAREARQEQAEQNAKAREDTAAEYGGVELKRHESHHDSKVQTLITQPDQEKAGEDVPEYDEDRPARPIFADVALHEPITEKLARKDAEEKANK